MPKKTPPKGVRKANGGLSNAQPRQRRHGGSGGGLGGVEADVSESESGEESELKGIVIVR